MSTGGKKCENSHQTTERQGITKLNSYVATFNKTAFSNSCYNDSHDKTCYVSLTK